MELHQLLKEFANPPSGYGPMPFWFWNDDLKDDDLLFQLDEMHDKGIESFFIHARRGLSVEYLSDTWFSKVGLVVHAAQKRNMSVWIYDEENWPSGYAGGRVLRENPDFCGKQVKRVKSGVLPPERIKLLATIGEYDYYLEYCRHHPAYAKGYYVDVLNKDATQSFLQHTHEQYYMRFKAYFGPVIKGFFVDEPGFFVNFTMYANGDDSRALPWTDLFPAYFQGKKGYDILPHLPCLWEDAGERTLQVKADYYDAVGCMYRENFLRVQRDYCEARGVQFIGHLHCEEFLPYHVKCEGDLLKGLAELHVPGIDRIDLSAEKVAEKYGSSAAHLMGAHRNLSETFCQGGWDMNLKRMKQWTNWQYVRGINMMIMHAFYASIEGDRKWEFPPSLFYQNFYWKHFRCYVDFVRRLSCILSKGVHVCNIGVYYPITTQYALIWPDTIDAASQCDRLLIEVSNALLDHQLDYDYLNDEAIAKAQTEDGTLAIRDEAYRALILAGAKNLPHTTVKSLLSFVQSGGTLVIIGEVPCKVIDTQVPEVAAKELGELTCHANTIRLSGFASHMPYTYKVNGDKLFDILSRKNLADITLRVPDTTIKYMHRELSGAHLYYIINESDSTREMEFFIRQTGGVLRLNPYDGLAQAHPHASPTADGMRIRASLTPYGEAIFLVLPGQEVAALSVPATQPEKAIHTLYLPGDNWKVTVGGRMMEGPLQYWSDWGLTNYSGTAEYETRFDLNKQDGAKYVLDVGTVYHTAEVTVNDCPMGALVWDPYSLDITQALRVGKNKLKITVSNTLGNELEQKAYVSGLIGPIKILLVP